MEIKNIKSDFVQITCQDCSFCGGSLEILDLVPELKDFSKDQASGFFSLTDLLLYEFAKFSQTKGTRGDLNLDLEAYSKFLRNYIDSRPYRRFGFLSLAAIEAYILRLADRRRIIIDTKLRQGFISKSLFENFIDKALENDHPLILQVGKRKNLSFGKYSLIVGKDGDSLRLVEGGQEKVEKISNIFSFSDPNLALLYIDAYL